MSRTAFLRSLIDTAGRGLEIGPSYNPLLPKAEGFRVETVDYTDAEGLRAKYRGSAHADATRIEDVDHVVSGRSLAETVQRPGCYDFIVASHVIEHTPDLLGFLRDCETLLKPDGALLLAVPDLRFCFDVLQPWSSTGAVIQAHLERRTRPLPGSIWDDRAYNAVRGEAIGWPFEADAPLRFFLDIEAAVSTFASDRRRDDYIDVHVWRFVPSSFRLMVSDLAAGGWTGLRERAFHGSVGNEFYAVLSTSGAGPEVDRLTLATRTLAEHARIPEADAASVVARDGGVGPDEAARVILQDQAAGDASRIALLEARLAVAEHDLRAARQDASALRASRSWQITRPLRALAERIGRHR